MKNSYFLILFFIAIQKNLFSENSLTLFIIKAPRNISWETPSSITWTAFKSRVNSDFHSIGHAMIHLQCDSDKEKPAFNEATGMTDIEHSMDKDLLFKKGTGLGVFFYDYPGMMNSEKYVWREVYQASEMYQRLATLKVLLSLENCQRLTQYLKEYKELKIYKHFGLSFNPRKKEGAGCTSFAASFFEVAGLLSNEIKKSWTLNLNVQENLIGHPFNNKFIETSSLLFGSEAQHWAQISEKNRPLLVYDPQFLYSWIETIWKKGEKFFPKNYFLDKESLNKWHKRIWISLRAPGTQEGWKDYYVSNGVMSLLIDARNFQTPQESIWIK